MDQAESEQNCSLQPIYWLGFGRPVQRDSITHGAHSAIRLATGFGIVDAIAIANIEAASTAMPSHATEDAAGATP